MTEQHANVKPCRSCGAPMVWMYTSSGKRIPVDADTCDPREMAFEPRKGHISHFATCPDAAKHRASKSPR